LRGDRADFRADCLRDGVGRDVRLGGNGPQDRQPLRRDLDAALPEKLYLVGHNCPPYQILE
jgi:hypothetical protein